MAEQYTEPKSEGQPSAVMTAHARYVQLQFERSPFLERARECAELTIPAIMPPEGSDGSTILPTPFQSVGARGVKNLASKLLLAMFPPGSAFFRLDIVRKVADQIQDPQAKADFEQALSRVENDVRARMEQKGTRIQKNEALRHLIVCGNFLLQILSDGALKGHPLDRYVVKRDLSGNVVEVVVVELLSRSTAPDNVKALIDQEATEEQDKMGRDQVSVYTWIRRDPSGRYWKIHQEVCSKIIPESRSTQPLDKCAWLPLRWTAIPGQDYGRGHCEELLGDLKSCDRLNRALLDGAAAASKHLFLVDPGGITQKKKVAQSRNLDVIDGSAKDITVMQVEKYADMKVVSERCDKVEKRLEQAFLLLSGSQRDAERVTAEEIRLLAQELEATLGGTYSVLSQEFQRPTVVRYLHQMQKSGDLPALPDKTVQPQIVTGIAGLGRTSDLQRLDALLAGVEQLFGQEVLAEYINVGDYTKRRAAALSIDIGGLVRSEEEVQQARAVQAQQAMAEKAVTPAIKAASDQQAQTPTKEGV